MAESYFQRRARELGLNLPAANTSGTPNKNESYFTRRSKELGLNLDPQAAQSQAAPTSNYASRRLTQLQQERDALSSPAANLKPETTRHIQDMQEKRLSPTNFNAPVTAIVNPTDQLNAALNFTAPRPAPPSPMQRQEPQPTGIPSFKQQVGNIQSQVGTGQSATDKWLQEQKVRRQERAQDHPVYGAIDSVVEPVNEFFDRLQTLPGISGFLQGANAAATGNSGFAPPVTGSPWVNKPAELIGGIAGLASIPGGGLGQNQISAPIQIGQQFTRDISNPLARVAARGITEGTLGGISGSLAAGQSDLDELSRNALLGGALGVGGEALVGLPGALARNARNAAQGVTRGNLNAANAIESAAASVPTGRLKVQGNTERLSRLIEEIRPIVTERMTPPLENPNQLSKWLQPHLNASLNQIRKLSYEDMRQLATEVQRSLSVEDTARVVARERGVDLDALLNQTAPTFRQEADRMRLGGVAGAIEPPQNVKVALSGNEPYQPNTATAAAEGPRESWFTKLFGTKGVGIAAGRQGKELIDTQVTSNAREPLKALDQARMIVEQTNQDYIDRFAPFRKINEDVYDAAMDSTKANNLANISIKDKMVDLEGNVIGDSLADVYKLVPRGKKNISDRYLIARDAVSRLERLQQVYGKEQWFPQTSEQAAQLVSKLERENPWLQQFGEAWNQFNRNRQDLWVESGIASKQLIDTLRYTNPNYTPMFRQQPQQSLSKSLSINTGKAGFSGQKAPIKRATGSGRKIIEPAQGMIETTASSYNAMLRNRAMQEIYSAVRSNPERYKGVFEIVEESPAAKQETIQRLNEAVNDNGADGIADILNEEVNQLWKKAKQSGNKTDNVVTVMIKGEPVKMRVLEPSLLKAIDGITPAQLEGFVRIADFVSRAVKQSATGLFAPFQGARLAVRDLPTAAAQSKDKLRFLQDISHAVVSQVGHWLPDFIPGAERLGKLAQDYYRSGGGYEAYLKGDSRIRAAARDITQDPFLSGRNIAKQIVKYNPLRPLKELGDAFENIPRIAAYAAEMRKSGWNKTPRNVRNALNASREATVNWSRRGSKTQNLESVAPYTNSAIQSTYRLVKRFKEQPVSAVSLIAAIAGVKIYAYDKFKDDPDYQQRSKFETGIPISKTADGKFYTIPVEPSDAYIADQVLNFYKWAIGQGEPINAKEGIQKGVESFTPSIISGPLSALTTQNRPVDLKTAAIKTAGGTVFEPGIALSTGKNFFGGDIIPREFQEDPTQLQYDETSSAPAKWAAENLGIDAFTFDYLANKFGGDIAKIGLPATSAVGRGDVQGNLIDQVNARVKLLEDPVMRNNISEDFYNRLKKVTDAAAISERKETPLPNWYQTAYDQVTSMKKGSINKAVSELNGIRKDILRDTTLTAKQRADQLRDVQRNINLLRIQGIKRLEELGVPK